MLVSAFDPNRTYANAATLADGWDSKLTALAEWRNLPPDRATALLSSRLSETSCSHAVSSDCSVAPLMVNRLGDMDDRILP